MNQLFDEPYIQQIYEQGQSRIDRMKEQLKVESGPEGIMPMPFLCWGCDERRMDLSMMTGDGLPLCVRCLGFVPTEEIVNG
jgi:hypothetical protein